MKKIVLRLDLHDDKDKQKAMKAVSILKGIDSIGMDMKEKKMTVTGSVDPVNVVSKLRKLWHTNVISIGPAKEEKKEEPKKEEEKKEEPKKEEEKKEEPKKEEKNEEPKKPHEQMIAELYNAYNPYNEYNAYNAHNAHNAYKSYYNPPMATQYYYVRSAEENPNSCNIL